jgi:uncharacterized protein YraI
VEEEPGETPAPAPAPRNPRQVRARRRRRRRQIGTLLFVLVAVGVMAAAYFALTGDDSSSNGASTTTTASADSSTTTTAPFSGSYPVTTGVNVRQGAGTTFPTVGTVEQGRPVVVACVAQGTPVDGPSGPNPNWLKITGPTAGYVSAVYVSVGEDLTTGKIPACPAG